MKKVPFKRGDRVVHTKWGAPTEGVAGTVMEVSTRPHHHIRGSSYFLLVILDTAEEILDELALFQLEDDYDPTIPF